MEIFKDFGFDPIMLGAQILNFLIIFFILKRFLYKPVLSMLKKREDQITEGIKQAEESRKLLEKTMEEEKKILSNAQIQAKKMIDDSRNQALEIAKEVELNTKVQTERMLEDVKAQIEQERREMEVSLTLKISELAADFLEKAAKDVFGDKEQKILIDTAVKKIKKAD